MSPEELFEQHKNLASTTIHIMFPNINSASKRNNIDPEDLFQYAYESLWAASLTFDQSKGRTFKNFAITRIRWEVVEKLRRDCRKFSFQGTDINPREIESKIGFVSLDQKANVNDEEASTYHELIGSNLNLQVEVNDKIICEKILDFVPPRTLEFIRLKANGVTIREIGKRYGISHQAVNIHIKKVINSVKRSGYVYELC